MKKKFEGKTLLVLGSNVGSADIVTYAKNNGAYTIVADYYPVEQSIAKQVADEAVAISTADVDALLNLVEERHVDGVLAGISEFNLLKALELSEKKGLPFYFNAEMWDKIENKGRFRSLCEKHRVPCPKTYYTGSKIPDYIWETIQYPVMLKPVDASSSRGVYRCFNEKELRAFEGEALQQSSSARIIVEESVIGDEFTAHYTIANGRVSLASVDDRYPVTVHEGDPTTIPVARIYPFLFLDEYLKQVDPYMKELCKDLGARNAILFVQGLYDNKTNSFCIFEAGLRSAGEAPYRFIKRINEVNAMDVLVDHVLSVPSEFASEKDDPRMKGKCCGIVSFVTKGGRVGEIIGLEEAVANTPSVLEYENRYPVGADTPNGRTLRQLMIRFVMLCENREQMERDIRYLNEHISVLDTDGNDMVIKMDPLRVYGTK